ncbi:15235_t:CDS:1, partial [Entrophospora sp. SA101]
PAGSEFMPTTAQQRISNHLRPTTIYLYCTQSYYDERDFSQAAFSYLF